MLNRFKTALYNVVGSFDPGEGGTLGSLGPGVTSGLPSTSGLRFPYTRPHFLQLGSEDEIQVTADHAIRPIICPRDISRLPWNSGYAETINAGKSKTNEDQAVVHVGLLTRSLKAAPASSSTTSSTQQNEGNNNTNTTATTTTNTNVPKTEAVVNGHSEDVPDHSQTTEVKTVMLQPRGGKHDQAHPYSDPLMHPSSNSLSASPANEVREGDTPSTLSISSNQASDSSSNNASSSQALTNTTQAHSASAKTANTSSHPIPISSSIQGISNATQNKIKDGPVIVSEVRIEEEKGKVKRGSSERESPLQEAPQVPPMVHVSLPYYLFGVFDGHAGWGAAVAAANQLHHIVHEKLCDVIDILIPDPLEKVQLPIWAPEREVTIESAVTGALEHAFWQMDHTIAEDRLRFQLTGGCTACVGLFIHGKLFLANAGDSRGILALAGVPLPMSFDFTPESENQRIRKLGAMHPELLGGEFTHLDFIRRPQRRDLGKRVLYRDHYMRGWAYKTLTQDDLKYPLVCGEGKRSRVLATIGVTRGFGDHDLKAQGSSILIKPFLTPEPEVRVFDIESSELTDGDVLVLATDGLWDITSNERAVSMVSKSLSHFPPDHHDKHKYRYTSAAQDLVMCSRGKLRERTWRISDDKHATIDDISVFVIPLLPYQEEHRAWKARQERLMVVGEEEEEGRIGNIGSISEPVSSTTNGVMSLPSQQQSQQTTHTPDISTSDSEKHIQQNSVMTGVEASDLNPQEDHFRSEGDGIEGQEEGKKGVPPKGTDNMT